MATTVDDPNPWSHSLADTAETAVLSREGTTRHSEDTHRPPTLDQGSDISAHPSHTAQPNDPQELSGIESSNTNVSTQKSPLVKESNAFASNGVDTSFAYPLPESWPDRPLRIQQKDLLWVLSWGLGIVMTLLPFLFIVVLACLALALDGQPLSDYGEDVVDVTRLGPTIYPILFAAVVSRFYRNLAHWAVARPGGITIGLLEQTLGSQSFAGAIERLLVVRTQLVLGSVILITWALSPLGGQSSSRLLYIGQNHTTHTTNVYYSNPSDQPSSYVGQSGFEDNRMATNTIYSASLLSSQEQQRALMDMWGRTKIPQFNYAGATGDWVDVDQNALLTGASEYSSLVGIKLQGLDTSNSTAIYNFTVESSYIDFKCVTVTTQADPSDSSKFVQDVELNITSLFDAGEDVESRISFVANYFPKRNPNNPSDDPPTGVKNKGPVHLLYASRDGGTKEAEGLGWTFALFNCSMRPTRVETNIRCGPFPSAQCAAYRQRLSPLDNQKEGLLPNMWASDYGPSLWFTFSNWPTAAGITSDWRMASPTDNFIAGDSLVYMGQSHRDWTNINITLFSVRLTTAFNTMWQSTLETPQITNATMSDLPELNVFGETAEGTNMTQAIVSTHNEVYIANRTWATILLMTTSILQLLAIFGLVLKLMTKSPDVLGFASSMTRDNPYIPLPASGSTLDGPNRARLLRNMLVQLADVRPGEEAGYIALRVFDKHQNIEGHLQKKWQWRGLRGPTRKRLYL